MDKSTAVAIGVVIFLLVVLAQGILYIDGEPNTCPIFYPHNDTLMWVHCWMLPDCEEIGCDLEHWSCGRPACVCRGFNESE